MTKRVDFINMQYSILIDLKSGLMINIIVLSVNYISNLFHNIIDKTVFDCATN
jgi:hypothetical protein